MVWNAHELRERVRGALGDRKLVVVSNREPYVHRVDGQGIAAEVPAGGLVAALDPVMRACGGTWVAHGSGDADRRVADARGRVAVPPGDPRYTLRRVWLSKAEETGYYEGFANQALWPLCHRAFVRPRFETAHWRAYQSVNRRFARAVLDEVADAPGALVLVQDYHFALLPRMLKAARPNGLAVGQFWHIPWPSPEALRLCPWAEEILDGVLGNDLIGFHTDEDCAAFLAATERRGDVVGCTVEDGEVSREGQRTRVRAFPISVDLDAIERAAAEPSVAAEAAALRARLGLAGQVVGLGVDRLDYTKGIPERLDAIDRFFERWPEHVGRFTFLQLGPTSRTSIAEYRRLGAELVERAAALDRKHGRPGWSPVRLLTANHPQRTLLAYYRLADVCVVSSLHDGMNLVAKEYVAARVDGGGALVLSEFAGAARELTDALPINPFDADGFAEALRRAVEMPLLEGRQRMAAMRAAVARNTVYDWAESLIGALAREASRRRPAPAPIDLRAERVVRGMLAAEPVRDVATALRNIALARQLRVQREEAVPRQLGRGRPGRAGPRGVISDRPA